MDAIVDAGATPIGLDAIETVRIEAGPLIAEEDYEPGVTDPIELRMERYLDLETTTSWGERRWPSERASRGAGS